MSQWQRRSRSSAATGSPSPARTGRTPMRPTRTCSPPRSTGSSRASACRASAPARSSPAPCSSTAATSTSRASACSARRSTTPRRPTTSSRRATPACRRRSRSAGKIALGQIDWGIAGGVDTTSDAPIAVNEDLRQVLLEANRRKSVAGRREAARPPAARPHRARASRATPSRAPGCRWASTRRSRPSSWGITREEQDELTVASHQGLAAAYERGFFDDLVTPYLGLERDQNLRPDSSTDKLAKLKPVFGDTMTAGNSTPLSDGAAVVLLASDAWAAAARPAGARAPHALRDGGGRLRPRRRRAADGARATPCRGCSSAPA